MKNVTEHHALTQEHLKEILHYDPETGNFTWINPPKQRPDRLHKIAGNIMNDGYWTITIDGKHRLAHRLAFLYMTGQWPKNLVDHINENKLDNRWQNLREANATQNIIHTGKQKSNTSGFKGVSWHPASNKWRARASYERKHYHLGMFVNIVDAFVAYSEFARDHFGEFKHSSTL